MKNEIMDKNKQVEIKTAKPIEISERPNNVNISKINIDKGKCFINSYRVAKQNANVEIIEGLIIVIDNKKNAKPMPHVWNRKNNIYFDVTQESVWIGKSELEEISEIKYFSTKVHTQNDFKNGDTFEFCIDTIENVRSINEILSKNKQQKL